MSFFTGFGVSALIYCLLNYFFPPRGSYFVGGKFQEGDVSADGESEGDMDDSDLEKTPEMKSVRPEVLVYEA